MQVVGDNILMNSCNYCTLKPGKNTVKVFCEAERVGMASIRAIRVVWLGGACFCDHIMESHIGNKRKKNLSVKWDIC